MSRLLLASLAAWALLVQPALAADAPDLSISSVEERRILTALEEQKQRLAQKEQELNRRDLELKSLEATIDQKLQAMKKLRDELDTQLAAKDEEEVRRIRDLSKMYEKMEPAKAAALLASLDRELAVSILGGIKAKVAGKLLNEMNPTVATRFSSAYSTIARD